MWIPCSKGERTTERWNCCTSHTRVAEIQGIVRYEVSPSSHVEARLSRPALVDHVAESKAEAIKSTKSAGCRSKERYKTSVRDQGSTFFSSIQAPTSRGFSRRSPCHLGSALSHQDPQYAQHAVS